MIIGVCTPGAWILYNIENYKNGEQNDSLDIMLDGCLEFRLIMFYVLCIVRSASIFFTIYSQ